MTTTPQKPDILVEFEDWARPLGYPLTLTKPDVWTQNPYAHTSTYCAYEAWVSARLFYDGYKLP